MVPSAKRRLADFWDRSRDYYAQAAAANGQHTVHFVTTDVLGNAGTKDVTYVLDNTGPVITCPGATITARTMHATSFQADRGMAISSSIDVLNRRRNLPHSGHML